MKLKKVNLYNDFVDELNFKWTSGILLLIISTIGVLRYLFLTSLISCWTPAHFTESHEDYAHQICWSTDKVYIPPSSEVPVHRKPQPTFHSKIPIILTIMLLGFQLPRLFKNLVGVFLGRSENLMQETPSVEGRERQIDRLTEIVRDTRNQSSGLRTVFLFITKFLVCINLLIQLMFVSTYFRDSVETVEEGNVTSTYPVYIFPYVMICDFPIRRLSNIESHTVQCLMPVNFLYENFFYYWWFWIIGVGLVSGFMSILHLASMYIPPVMRLRFRGILPSEYLSLRGCSMADDLLILTDIMNSSGQAMAREVAMKVCGKQPRDPSPGQSKPPSSTENETLLMHDK